MELIVATIQHFSFALQQPILRLELLLLLLHRTAHVSPVLHTVASCALLAQLVLFYMETVNKN